MAKIVVLEGPDGSGKSTQSALLSTWFQERNILVKHLKFPRYDTPSGQNITRYLRGEFGKNAGDVNPYAASAIYAVDRYASYRSEWLDFYENEKDGILFLDRYTPSNAIHQGAKLPETERIGFFRWLEHFEYEEMGLPQPDMVLALDMPPEYTMQLTARRGEQDIHEKDPAFIIASYKSMLAAADLWHWHLIPTVQEGKLLTVERVHGSIVAEVEELLKNSRAD